MAATRKSAGRKSTARKSSSSRRGGGNKAIDRASASLDASSKALRDLRDELQKGGSKLARDADLRDLEKTLKSAGTSFRSIGKRLLKDLEDVQRAASGKGPAKRKSSGGKKRKSTAKRATSGAKKTAKRATSSAKKARSTAGKKAGGKKAGGSKKRSSSKKR